MNEPTAPKLSIIIPTLNAAAGLSACLNALDAWPETKEVFIVDGGSEDETIRLAHSQAHNFNVTILPAEPGRGGQLRRGGLSAQGHWLLFLHADTVLGKGWADEVQTFMADIGKRQRVGAFRFTLDEPGPQARRVERMVAWRCRKLGLPYGDQGLLVHQDRYKAVGGYRSLPLMEDVDLIRRLGRNSVHMFETSAKTSAARFRRDGWWFRPSRNLFCLFLYLCGLPPRWIAKLYA